MTHSKDLDPARLAALIDGRLSDADAAELRKQLAAADDDSLAAFADAVVIAGEITSNPDVAGHNSRDVIPLAPRRRPRWVLPAFASAAAIAAVTVISLSRASRSDGYPPGALATAVPSSAALPESPLWNITRGAAEQLSPRVQAVRIGVLLTDLELRTLRRDTVAREYASLSALLDGVRGADSIASAMRHAPSAATDRQALGQKALEAVDLSLARAGAYLEAARLATGVGDTSFVDRFVVTGLAVAQRSPLLDDASRSALRQAAQALGKRPRSAGDIHAVMDASLRVLTQ
ncbi:MAG: hypothetical protein ABJE47_22145 [bacterium]